jgi:hypothetical protein
LLKLFTTTLNTYYTGTDEEPKAAAAVRRATTPAAAVAVDHSAAVLDCLNLSKQNADYFFFFAACLFLLAMAILSEPVEFSAALAPACHKIPVPGLQIFLIKCKRIHTGIFNDFKQLEHL